MQKEIEYKITDRLTSERIETLLKIEKEKGLTAENVIEEASDFDNPLHDIFDWDNRSAGYKYRLAQARILVNEIKVVIDSKEYFAFENVKVNVSNGDPGRVYKPIVEIFNNENLKRQILITALKHLSYWEKQYGKYEELSAITKAASKVRKHLDKLENETGKH